MVVSLDPLRLDLFLKCSGSSKAFGVEGLKVQTEVESSRVWCEVWARLVSDL